MIRANFVSNCITSCICFLVEFFSPPNSSPICKRVPVYSWFTDLPDYEKEDEMDEINETIIIRVACTFVMYSK